jgi:hypothetical protein
VNSQLHADFRRLFSKLPAHVQVTAWKNYQLWLRDPKHPSLEFKRVSNRYPAWSVRIGIAWRAMRLVDGDTITWFWIGPHAEYDRLLKTL